MGQKTYRIGEAAAKLKLKSYVLRFWETEFSQISPIRTEKGQRLYTESDLIVLLRIRYLLHERGLTIDGARRLLREEAEKGALFANADILPSGDALNDQDASAPNEPDDEFDDDFQDCPGGDSDDGPGSSAAGTPGGELPVPHAGSGPAQADLFSAAPSAKGVFPETELREILTELAAIYHLLVFEIPGDTP